MKVRHHLYDNIRDVRSERSFHYAHEGKGERQDPIKGRVESDDNAQKKSDQCSDGGTDGPAAQQSAQLNSQLQRLIQLE